MYSHEHSHSDVTQTYCCQKLVGGLKLTRESKFVKKLSVKLMGTWNSQKIDLKGFKCVWNVSYDIQNILGMFFLKFLLSLSLTCTTHLRSRHCVRIFMQHSVAWKLFYGERSFPSCYYYFFRYCTFRPKTYWLNFTRVCKSKKPLYDLHLKVFRPYLLIKPCNPREWQCLVYKGSSNSSVCSQILWCDHSNKPLVALSKALHYFLALHKEIWTFYVATLESKTGL